MKDCNIILSSSPKAYLKQMENINNKGKNKHLQVKSLSKTSVQ